MQDPPEQSRLNLVRTPTILQCTPRAVLTNAQRLLCRTCISSAAYSMVCVPEPKRRDIRIYRWIRKCHYSFRGDPYIRRTPCNTSQWAQQIRDVLQTCGLFANLSWCLVHFLPLHFVLDFISSSGSLLTQFRAIESRWIPSRYVLGERPDIYL